MKNWVLVIIIASILMVGIIIATYNTSTTAKAVQENTIEKSLDNQSQVISQKCLTCPKKDTCPNYGNCKGEHANLSVNEEHNCSANL